MNQTKAMEDVKRPMNQLAPMPIPRPQATDSWAKRASKRVFRNVIVPAIDWTLKITASLFVVATSLHDVDNWLHQNRLNHDFSLVGAILVLSVAVYLIVRKR